MKKSKKLLLAGISAMSLVAVATGAVSTFAWYAASQSATIASKYSVTISTSSQGLSDIKLYVNFTIAADSDVELTNGSGKTYYISNGRAVEKTTAKKVGTWTVSSPEWVTTTTGDYSDNAYTAALVASLTAQDYTVTLGSESNVHLQAAGAWSSTDATPTFTLKVAAGGGLSLAGTLTGGFNVRAVDDSIEGSELTAASELVGHASDAIKVVSIAKAS